MVLTKLAPRLVQNNETLTLNNSAKTVAALDCHEEDKINSLKICDKTDNDSNADDKSAYQCASDDKLKPKLMDSSDCDSDTGLQSFLITGSSDKDHKRRSPSPMKSDSKKRQTSSLKPDGQRPTSSSKPDVQRATSSSSSKSDEKRPASSVKKINWGNSIAAPKTPQQEDTEKLDKEQRLRLLEQDLD